MIGNFSIKHGPGNRKISFGKGNKWVAVTAGEGSYVIDANLEFGSTRGHVLIGRYCSIAHRVTFVVGLNHDYSCVTTYPFEDFELNDPIDTNHAYNANKYQIIIGNDVWIGCDVTILGGVRIGNGAVIGAGTVVARDIPSYSVVVGNPAKVIKYRFEEDVISHLQNIKWWYWPVEKIKSQYHLMKDIGRFLQNTKEESQDGNEDETVLALKAIKEDSFQIYYLYADFEMEEQIWRSVLQEYLVKFTQDDHVVLVVEITGNHSGEYIAEMARIVEAQGDNAPIVVTHETDGISPGLIKLIDIFITTKDESSSVVVDFLSGSQARIIYGLDYEGHIFD